MPYLEQEFRRIHYRIKGEGPLLFILPGNTASSACHIHDIDYFSDRFTVVSPDFWGTGRSSRIREWPKEWWTIASIDIAEIIKNLEQEHAFIMGTSGGASIALHTAILYPHACKAVIADSTVEIFHAEQMLKNLAQRQHASQALTEFWRTAHGEDWQEVVEADTLMLTRLAKKGGDIFGGRLHKIKCPVLLTASLLDTDLPDAENQLIRMAKKIADSQLFLYNGGGHPLGWTAASVFRAECDRFLSQIMRSDEKD